MYVYIYIQIQNCVYIIYIHIHIYICNVHIDIHTLIHVYVFFYTHAYCHTSSFEIRFLSWNISNHPQVAKTNMKLVNNVSVMAMAISPVRMRLCGPQ